MKKLVSLLLAVVMVLGMMSFASAEEMKIAMITDYGDITDQSFNQTTWEAVVKFSTDNNIEYKYYKPDNDDTASRVAKVELAIAEGYNVIVMPGYAFGGTIAEISGDYPDVKFIALDVAKGDLLEGGVPLKGQTYDWNPDNWNLTDYVYMDNVYSAIYQEELCGYMAGYAAVKLGYTDLGFLGGMAVPAVVRYGFGFVQGCDAAAKELGINVNVKYVYGNQFAGDADITAYMDNWYQNGTQVVFACGGGIFTSAVDAAKKVEGAKVIGVDVDQAAVITNYAAGEGASEEELAKWADLTVTSAMKGLAPTTIDTLTDVIINGNWANYVGKIDTLGLVSEDPAVNYVQIAGSTQFEEGKFTAEDYKALVKGMFEGTITVSNDIVNAPAVTNSTVEYLGNIK
ncbi:MAG: BMP family ABC transporter substrate-binding protein [Clostridiales bacterium]|nr:BMP family ABC transporter substrate-binding protein [Clostridiales bacterium]